MWLKKILSLYFARHVVKKNSVWKNNPINAQNLVFKKLIKSAKKTSFGQEHNFEKINTYDDFIKHVPVRDYEGLKKYINKIISGKENVLWPGTPLYFCKTSGTTSGAKYIPISKESMPNHLNAARDAILNYIAETKNTSIVSGKMIFLQGSPKLSKKGGVSTGRLSGIVAHHIPFYLKKNRLPSFKTNCIEDWDEKLNQIVCETEHQNMTLISGIPPWVQMYFEKLKKKHNKNIKEIFKNFNLFIYGGVNFEPYRNSFSKIIGKKIDSVELYPASEGFIAYQDSQKHKGMLLCVDNGIFYEFIRADEFFDNNPKRITLKDVRVGINYVIILNTNAGLWGYNIGDTVRFVSTKPYRLIVSGRIKHFTSAFGEHVIAEEVEKSLDYAVGLYPCEIKEFHVAPEVNPKKGAPYHEWFIEFAKKPKDIVLFERALDKKLQSLNSYYKDLIVGGVLTTLKITFVKKDGFIMYMQSIGKLGGQNKTPRLSNDRVIADKLKKYLHG